jgi:hypothetical protein
MEQKTRQGWSIGPQVIVGIFIVIFGLVLTASNLGFGRFSVAIRFWPMVFTAIGVALLLEKGSSSSRRFWGFAFVIGGLWQTAVEAFGLRFYINDWWPLVLVGLGVLLVVKSIGQASPPEDYTNMGAPAGGSLPPSSVPGSIGASASGSGGAYAAPPPQPGFAGGEETVNAFAFLGGVRRNIVSPAFRRGNLTAIMGGVVLDMRQSQATGGETVVEVFAMWGGIEVKVPPDWQVANEIVPIMGGVEDRSLHTQPIRHRLVLKGVVLMAGVEVKS